MISRDDLANYPEVNWDVYKSQQAPVGENSTPNQAASNRDFSGQPSGYGSSQGDKGQVDTFMGKLPSMDKMQEYFKDPELVKQMSGAAALGPGMDVMHFGESLGPKLQSLESKAIEKGGELAKKGYSKISDYLQPGKEAEKFRSSLGEGTSTENIEQLGKRAQFAKESTKQQALIPKDKIYAQEGKSDVYKVNPKELPEGNLQQTAEMVDPGGKFGDEQIKALQSALGKFRAGKIDKEIGGEPIDSFLHKAEEIFNIPELPEKAAEKIENVLSMPTKRDSEYFNNKKVEDPYYEDSNVHEKHIDYSENRSLENYDALQSAIKKEMRKISDKDSPRYHQLELNAKNLDKDKENFMQTLPENIKNLENEFRQQYRNFAETYEKPAPGKADVGASKTLRRLAEGKNDLVTDSQIQKVFANPTAADKKIILQMGPSAARNALYAALQRVKPNDAEGMANTILDLKRTKGFDKIINSDMEKWATNMLKNVRNANLIKKAMGIAAGGAAGSAFFGPVGGAIGAGLPFIPKGVKGLSTGAKFLAEKLRK